jgi:hypothetical protein
MVVVPKRLLTYVDMPVEDMLSMVVSSGSAFPDSLFGIKDRGKILIFHKDPLQCLAGGIFINRGHSRHLIPFIADLILGKDRHIRTAVAEAVHNGQQIGKCHRRPRGF